MPAKSKNQQQFMGMVHAIQEDKLNPNKVSKEVRNAAKSISKSDAKEFAETKQKGLPEKVGSVEELIQRIKFTSGKILL